MKQFIVAWFTHLRWHEVIQILRVNRVRGPQGPIMTQVNLIGILGWALRIHVFHQGDGDEYHSHPRGFVSLCLCGSYRERLLPSGERTVQPGTITVRQAKSAHNVTPLRKPCVTLVGVAPVTRKWHKETPP